MSQLLLPLGISMISIVPFLRPLEKSYRSLTPNDTQWTSPPSVVEIVQALLEGYVE